MSNKCSKIVALSGDPLSLTTTKAVGLSRGFQ